MSALVRLAGVRGAEPMVGGEGVAAEAEVPVHCGVPMERVAPAVGRLGAGYTFNVPAVTL